MKHSPTRLEGKAFWSSFARSLGADPREHLRITGVSGVEHNVQAIAVDDRNHRVIVVSAEPNPRMAAMMQVDLQATMPDTRVLIARPVLFDLPVIAQRIVQELGISELNLIELSRQAEELKGADDSLSPDQILGPFLGPMLRASQMVTLPTVNQVLALVQQLAWIKWSEVLETLRDKSVEPKIPLVDLLEIDTIAVDREHGICSIPLYEFTEEDWDLFLSGTRKADMERRLRELGIYQYFFPPADQLALGLVDRGTGTREKVATAVELAPVIGHPHGDPEILRCGKQSTLEMIDELQERNLLFEGETGIETTPEGERVRSTIRYRPREGALVKVLRMLNVNIGINVGL